jgi:hypothetical protein
LRLRIQFNRKGDVSIGYMFVLIISALVMTAMSLVAANFIASSSEVAKEVQVQQVAVLLEMEVEEAIYMGSNHPNCIYHKNITLPKEIYGVQFRITLTTDAIYINGTLGEIREKRSINPPPFLKLSGSVPSTAGVAMLSYDGNGRIQIL